jgi:excisionase family DNA binding protein
VTTYHLYYGRMTKPKELKEATVSGFFTVEEAAAELGVKQTAIRNYLCDGKMTTYKFKTLTLIRRDEVEGWKHRQERQRQRVAS